MVAASPSPTQRWVRADGRIYTYVGTPIRVSLKFLVISDARLGFTAWVSMIHSIYVGCCADHDVRIRFSLLKSLCLLRIESYPLLARLALRRAQAASPKRSPLASH